MFFQASSDTTHDAQVFSMSFLKVDQRGAGAGFSARPTPSRQVWSSLSFRVNAKNAYIPETELKLIHN